MNVGIGTVASQFLSWEYLLRIFRCCVFAAQGTRSRGKAEPKTYTIKNVPVPFPAPSQDVMDHKLFLAGNIFPLRSLEFS
jgi:hypothetical protein